MIHYTDKEMIVMLTNTSPISFGKVVDYITQKLVSRIYHFVLNNGGRKEDVEEILNDAFMVAHQFSIEHKFKENTSVEAFVFQVTKYTFWRKIKNEKKAPIVYVEDVPYNISSTPFDFEDTDFEDEQLKVLKEVITNLKDKDKGPLIDFYWKKMSMKEIAVKYDLGSDQAAKNKLYRIRERLKKIVNKLNETVHE